MRNLFSHKARKYFRRERGMAYDERGPEVRGPWRATSFVEATIKLGFYANTSALPSHDVAVIRDAFLEGRFADARAIAAQHGFSLGLTITGTYGAVVSEREAMRIALESNTEYFNDAEALADFNNHNQTRYRSPERAARYAMSFDGRYSGLDVHDTGYRTVRESKNGIVTRTRGQERVLVTEGCGCVHDKIAACFPEFASLIPWHLNTMRASEDGNAWLVEELPDSVLETVRALVLAEDNAKASKSSKPRRRSRKH